MHAYKCSVVTFSNDIYTYVVCFYCMMPTALTLGNIRLENTLYISKGERVFEECMLSEVDLKFVETVDAMKEVAASDTRIKCLNEMVSNWTIAEWIKQCFSGKIPEFLVLVYYQYGYLAIFH